MAKVKGPPRTDVEIRKILLQYFYDRNHNATSARSDKTGAAAKISIVRKDLKAAHGLSVSEVWRNLTYLLSERWVEEKQIEKSVPLRTGTVIPQVTSYYQITSAGIDKIEGPGEFTMPKFQGININATGQTMITVGDGNQVNAQFGPMATALAELRAAISESPKLTDVQKLEAVSDIETVQDQLAKPEPNRAVIRAVWPAIQRVSTIAGLVGNLAKVGALIAPLLGHSTPIEAAHSHAGDAVQVQPHRPDSM